MHADSATIMWSKSYVQVKYNKCLQEYYLLDTRESILSGTHSGGKV